MTCLSPNILLVGRHAGRIQHLDRYLATAGWRYALAHDSAAALEALECSQFDIVIADLEFSNTDDDSLIKSLRRKNPSQAVIVVSHDGSLNEAITVLREGAADFLQYPVDFDTLERSVSDILLHTRSSRNSQNHFRFLTKHYSEYTFTSVDLVATPFELDFLHDLENRGAITGDDRLKIVLAFQEAITNSLEHGNLELKSEWKDEFNEDGIDNYSLRKKARLADPVYGKRTVQLQIEYNPAMLRIIIRDQGPGFSVQQPVLTDVDTSIRCYGRGLAIIGSAMDAVEYREGGRLIEMHRRLNTL